MKFYSFNPIESKFKEHEVDGEISLKVLKEIVATAHQCIAENIELELKGGTLPELDNVIGKINESDTVMIKVR